MRQLLGNWIRWLNLMLVIVTLFAYLSPFIDPANFGYFAILGLFFPWLLAANLLFIVYWIIRRRKYFLFSAGVILVGFQHCERFVGFHQQDTATVPTLKVMTYNCRQLVPRKNTVKNWTPEELATLVRRYQPDVLCLQEFSVTPYSYKPSVEAIATLAGLNYHYSSPHEGLAVFSRFPLGETRKTVYYKGRGKNNGYQYVDVQTDRGVVRVFNIHLQTNAVSRMADHVLEEGQLKEKKTWLEVKGMIGRYKRSTSARAVQAREIAAQIEKSPHPVLICGDFNDVPQSYVYRRLAKGRKDSFQYRGKGFATTFNGGIPALRIDYLLAAPDFKILGHQTIHDGYSDHYPILGSFLLKKK